MLLSIAPGFCLILLQIGSPTTTSGLLPRPPGQENIVSLTELNSGLGTS